LFPGSDLRKNFQPQPLAGSSEFQGQKAAKRYLFDARDWLTATGFGMQVSARLDNTEPARQTTSFARIDRADRRLVSTGLPTGPIVGKRTAVRLSTG